MRIILAFGILVAASSAQAENRLHPTRLLGSRGEDYSGWAEADPAAR